MIEGFFGLVVGAAAGYAAGYHDGQRSAERRQCWSSRSFAGGEAVYRCRLDAGHAGGHLGVPA